MTVADSVRVDEAGGRDHRVISTRSRTGFYDGVPMDLDHIVLAVASLSASLPYYDALFALLGFEKTRDHVYVNGQGIGIDLKEAASPSYGYKREGVGLNHLAVRATSRGAVDTVAASMRAAGFDVPAAQTIDRSYALFMRDPDGIRIEVVLDE